MSLQQQQQPFIDCVTSRTPNGFSYQRISKSQLQLIGSSGLSYTSGEKRLGQPERKPCSAVESEKTEMWRILKALKTMDYPRHFGEKCIQKRLHLSSC